MAINNNIITYEHDKIYCCNGICDNCSNSSSEYTCCINSCKPEHFEELKDYCTKENLKSGFDYIPKEQCISIDKYTGLIQLKDGTYLEILPKLKEFSIDESRVIFKNLILASHNLTKEFKTNKDSQVQIKKDNYIIEVFITVFCKDLKEILKKGIKKSYIRNRENLNVYKGKLLFSKQIQNNLVSKHKFFVEYSQYTINIAENRILKSACLYLIKKTSIKENKNTLKQMLIELCDVDICTNLEKDIEAKQINRLNAYYDRPLKYAEFFLKKSISMPKRGSSKLPSLLFPLNEMFQDYIKNLLSPVTNNFYSQYSKHYLIKTSKEKKPLFNTIMDFVIFNNNKALILDAKWKELNPNAEKFGVEQFDLYQLFNYSKILKSLEENIQETEVILLYPKTPQFNSIVEWEYFNGTAIKLVPVDVLDTTNNELLLRVCK